MTDEPVRTQVRTDDGWLDFQDYFVRLRQAPDVREVRFAGIEAARPTPEVAAAIEAADDRSSSRRRTRSSRSARSSRCPGMRELLAAARARGAPIVAVSGIIGGKALKGPADRMLASLGHEATRARRRPRLRRPDRRLRARHGRRGARRRRSRRSGSGRSSTDTIMTDDASRARLAAAVLAAAGGA